MRVHEREGWVPSAKTHLELKLHSYQWPGTPDDAYGPSDRDIDDVEMLRAVTFEIREILLGMDPAVSRAAKFSALKDLIRDHQKETGLTDIEVLQALYSFCEGKLKYMLRYERHGDYEKPAGMA